MNERIKELYIQTANETADGKEWAIGGLINAEKFAELIVQECIDIVSAGISNVNDWDSSYWDQACENRAQAIKKHFGVE